MLMLSLSTPVLVLALATAAPVAPPAAKPVTALAAQPVAQPVTQTTAQPTAQPVALEFPGVLAASPIPAAVDRLRSAPSDVQATVQWIAASQDNGGLPFLVVDKVEARVYAFTPQAQLKATAPVLLGMGKGDVMLVPNDAPMSAIPPAKRITPAGRYRSWLMKDHQGKQVLSIDYDAAISMHIVAPGTPAERRAARLASATPADNRVSFGCINVPPAFFTQVVSPDFTPAKGVVYILPETKSAAQLFGFAPPAGAPIETAAPAVPASPALPQASPAPGAVAAPVIGAN
jgi:hypothetical protein